MFDDWTDVVLLVTLTIAVGRVAQLRRRCKTYEARQWYWYPKRPMCDATFLELLRVSRDDQRAFCLDMRQRIARQARVSNQLVLPTDRLVHYEGLEYKPPDARTGVETMARHVKEHESVDVRLACETYGEPSEDETLEDYLRFFVTNWDRFVLHHQTLVAHPVSG